MTPSEQVAAFNERVPVGSLVLFVRESGREVRTCTRAAAQVMADGRPVVWLDNRLGAVPLSRVRVG